MNAEDRSKVLTRMIVGDLDKPFHLPECCCDRCEDWRAERGRPTYAEMLAAIKVDPNRLY